MAQLYFLVMVVGVPLGILLIAMLAGHFYPGGHEEILDWKPTRSPAREAELQRSDVDQMLAAQNRYRRRRGAPARSLEEVTEHAWGRLKIGGESLWPPNPAGSDDG
jgi:hypothetical protein